MKEAVFLSASIPDPKRNVKYARSADTVAIASAVSALLYVTLGRRPLIWGGHPAITPMVVETCDAMGVDYGKWVRLYQSEYFKDQYPEDNHRFKNTVYTGVAKDGSLEASLKEMRLKMLSDSEFIAGVFIGGMQGITEEADMLELLQPGAHVVPVASTGGAALELAERRKENLISLQTDLEYVGLFHKLLGISEKENRYPDQEKQPIELADRESRN